MPLSYINEMPDRMPILDSLLEDSSRGAIKLYTSDITRVEVAFAVSEREQKALDPEVEQKIDRLWNDPSIFTMVEFHSRIAIAARDLIRDSISRSWSLKPLDAVHLATAQWLSRMNITIEECHTYDKRLFRYETIVEFKIMEPTTLNPKLL